MAEQVRKEWKGRIFATGAVLLSMLVIMALWCRGRPFGKVLQIDSAQVGRIVVVRTGTTDIELTDRGSIEEFMSFVNHFRYQAYYNRSGFSGCVPERYVKLLGHSGQALYLLFFSDQGITVNYNDVYLSSAPYFESFCRQLHLKSI